MDPQWVPDTEARERARITEFARFVGKADVDYRQLWQWSVERPDTFWRRLWEFFELGPTPETVLATAEMPGAQWFPEVRLNYVDQVVRNAREDRPAIVDLNEDGDEREISWQELLDRTAALAQTLREFGVGEGDRVVGYLPNIAEAVIAFLASASIGAIWSACGQDYTAKAALDRLAQLEPVVLVAADGYRYGGRVHDRVDEVRDIRAGLPTLRATILVSRMNPAPDGFLDWDSATSGAAELHPAPVAFDHPLWVVFSSGTTGLPKGIVHGHGGVLLEHLKAVGLHSDIGADDVFFWFTSPSWMMWNFQVAGLLVGATIVCYDGSPSFPRPDALWELASRREVTVLGTSPGYVLACEKTGVVPRNDHDLAALRSIGVTGSALPPSLSLWLRDNVGARVSSISGGTDVVSAFLGGTPTVPVWPGELSGPYLGVALDSFDANGKSVRGQVGELVLTQPLPSMPIYFWNDPDGTRYRQAYFDAYPGVWRHGDWIMITEHGGVTMHGRSDSTLNRNGIRMGSSDIYQAVERMPEVAEALVIGAEQPDGGYWMPLFIVPTDGVQLDAALIDRIKAEIRASASPRHVPDEIILAPGFPHTRTGKKLEIPIKRILQGADPAAVVDRGAVDAPDLLNWFAEQALARDRGV
ncbi:acetoacetate--CoA ligase [Nocardia coffeae]|uniref:acetoacetate--CoA ligase n=1 Tax=Nocardia coffeae TaxID=2873381 RepID=UPI003556931A